MHSCLVDIGIARRITAIKLSYTVKQCRGATKKHMMCWTAAMRRAHSVFRGQLFVASCAMPKSLRFVLLLPGLHNYVWCHNVQVLCLPPPPLSQITKIQSLSLVASAANISRNISQVISCIQPKWSGGNRVLSPVFGTMNV